ncbi:hypothetical protein Btru_018715 [Bulinus truncatus]|nr:hypothetical protein Btru_018715 [Bulinus truncatus]
MSKPQCHVTESCIMLLLMLTTSPGLSYGASLLHPGERLESALCHAQCLALCREMTNVSQCDCEVSDSIVKDASNNTLWLSECAGQQRYACQGTCSSFQNQSGAAPARAEVRLYNDAQNRQLILKWTPPSPSDTWVMIYIAAVVQAGQIWTPVAEVSDETEVKLYNRHGPCYSPDIRVAAVSSAGMSGFSASVRTKVSQPGQPRNIEVTRLDYRPSSSYDSETVHYTLQWRPDTGWSVQDVQYQVTVEAECPDGLLDQVYVINDSTQHNEESFFLNGQIPTYAFGCKFTFKIILTRACDQKVHRDITEYNFTLNCKDVENYTGDNCNEKPVVDPGPVREVKVTEVQLSSGDVLVMVSWLPPENLGSAGYVSSYHVVWGLVNTSPGPSLTDFLFQMDFVKVLGNMTLPGVSSPRDLLRLA